MKAITYTDWKINGSMLPFCRVACVATQLTSLKVVDKVSKLLNKGDLERLKSHQASKSLSDVETLLDTAWKSLQLSGHLSEDQQRAVFGRYCVRLVLFVRQKQKFGREAYVWQSVEEIAKAFADERAQPAASTAVASPLWALQLLICWKWASLTWRSTRTSTSSWARHTASQSCMTKSELFSSPCLMKAASLNTPPCWGRSLCRMCLWMRKFGRTKRWPAVHLNKAIAEQYLVQSSKVSADMLQMAQYQLKLHEEHKNLAQEKPCDCWGQWVSTESYWHFC